MICLYVILGQSMGYPNAERLYFSKDQENSSDFSIEKGLDMRIS